MIRRSNIYPIVFITVGILIQCITFYYVGDTTLSFISSLLGIVAIVLCAQGNILHFFFGIAQITTYLWICYQQHLYGSVGLNIFYLITQFVGLVIWRKRLNGSIVRTKRIGIKGVLIITTLVLLTSFLVGVLMARYTDNTQPYWDAFCTIPAIVGQILMIMVYREQYYCWLFVDCIGVIMWLLIGNVCLAMQYLFWVANCIYGFVTWTKISNIELK